LVPLHPDRPRRFRIENGILSIVQYPIQFIHRRILKNRATDPQSGDWLTPMHPPARKNSEIQQKVIRYHPVARYAINAHRFLEKVSPAG
jgi:hypothetical protein